MPLEALNRASNGVVFLYLSNPYLHSGFVPESFTDTAPESVAARASPVC